MSANNPPSVPAQAIALTSPVNSLSLAATRKSRNGSLNLGEIRVLCALLDLNAEGMKSADVAAIFLKVAQSMTRAAVYQILHRCEQREFVKSEWFIPKSMANNQKPHRVYTITLEGQRAYWEATQAIIPVANHGKIFPKRR
jgi:DNA-binding PadR family transcriptional regulator